MKRLIYIGRRENYKGSHQAFLCQNDGKEYYWKRVKYVVIGGVYECTNAFKISRAPKVIEYLPEEQIKQEWKDLDESVDATKAKTRALKKAQRLVKNDWSVIEPLHRRCKKLDVMAQFEFAELVRQRVLKGK